MTHHHTQRPSDVFFSVSPKPAPKAAKLSKPPAIKYVVEYRYPLRPGSVWNPVLNPYTSNKSDAYRVLNTTATSKLPAYRGTSLRIRRLKDDHICAERQHDPHPVLQATRPR